MGTLQVERVADTEAASQDNLLQRVEGGLLLTSFVLTTLCWCFLLALGAWKALFWLLDYVA